MGGLACKMQPSSAVQVGKESGSDMAGPVSRTGWWMWVKLVKAGLGVILGAIAFFIFTFVYGNIAAGAWALISAMFAGLVLHLHIVYKHHRLELYYSAYRLAVVRGISTAVTIYYAYLKISMNQ